MKCLQCWLGRRNAAHVILYEDASKKRVGQLVEALAGLRRVKDALEVVGRVSERGGGRRGGA